MNNLTCLYNRNSKKDGKSKIEILDEYLKEHAINNNISDIEKLKERLKRKPLLLEKALGPSSSGTKRKKKNTNANKRLGRKAAKALNLYEIPKDDQKYERFLPLHHLWKSYIQNLFSNKDSQVCIRAEERILKVDYHGAEILVKNSKCKSYVGCKGIIVKETKNMFEMITAANELKLIPKRETLFELCVHGFKVTIYGNAIIGRPGERIVKKFKNSFNSDMILG